jgi:parallel beta-helix repeat protein
MCITPSFAIENVKKSSIPISDKSVIIVDDEGDGDYTSILDAVGNAKSGDIIEVYSGIYNEKYILITTENITLRGIPYEFEAGNDLGKPVIKDITKLDTLITVTNSEITIYGFVMEANLSYRGIVTFYNGDNNVFSNCDLIKGHGINIYTSNNRIINNNFSDLSSGIHIRGINNFVIGNKFHNIRLESIVINSSYCNISGNLISDCRGGILIEDDYNVISNNKISNCDKGIYIESNNNKISNNIISNCDKGIQITEQPDNVIIEYNELRQNKLGIVTTDQGQNSMICHNNFIQNSRDAWVGIHKLFPSFHIFNENYWDKWNRIGPKRIFGWLIIPILFIPTDFFPLIFFIPILKTGAFDLHPAKEPYDI